MSVASQNGAGTGDEIGSEGCIGARHPVVQDERASFDAFWISQRKMQIMIGNKGRTVSQHTTSRTAPVFRCDF